MLRTMTMLALILLLGASAQAGRPKKVWPPSMPVPGAELKPNQWVAIEKHGAGRRGAGAVVYLPAEKSFVLMLGVQGAWNDRGPWCYDEQTFSLKSRLWKNRFPPGKNWEPEVGPCKNVPGVRYGRLTKGRLGLSEARFLAYAQYTLDTDSGLVYALANRMFLVYDPAKRTWRDLKAKGHPSTGSRFSLMWGSLCYDAHNKEIVLFGGNNGGSKFNDTRTWIYSPAKNEWRRGECTSALMKGFYAKAAKLRADGEKLYGAGMNRYFKTELPAEGKVKLGAMTKALGAKIDALSKELSGKGAGTEQRQLAQVAADLKTAKALLARIGDAANPEGLKAGLALKRMLRRAEHGLLGEPPPRAHSPMVYDPATKKIVLFGGDRLDMLYADTWTYDCKTRKWQQCRPELSPSPRAGHAFLYLPESKKLALVGGYKYDSQTGYWGPLYRQLPMQAWTYDVAANKWAFVKQWPLTQRRKKVSGAAPRYMSSKGAGFTLCAGEGDVLLFAGSTTYACKLDVSKPDAAGAAKLGAKPGSAEWRTGPYDPNWYLAGEVPADSAFQAKLKAVPANTWTVVTGKGTLLPRQNRDWGTAVFDPDREAIYRWSGGHSAHCGSDIPVFSMKTGRYHQKYAPAFPLGGIGSCGSQPSRGTFLGQPWVSAHTYHSYAYDNVSRKMICCGHNSFSFAFDPADSTWTHKRQPKGMDRDNFYTLTLCSTPTGPYAWTKFGALFKYDGKADTWSQVKVSGEKLVGTRCDNAGMCYDSKRNRLIMTHSSFKGDLMAVDLKTLVAKRLKPKGMAKAAAGGHFLRETCYDAANDVVVVARRGKRRFTGAMTWPVYDCAKNAWIAVEISGPNCSGCSMGLMYDPKRKNVVAVDTNSRIYILKLDMSKGKALED
jgi:Galactose oxidase, central domain